MTAGSYAIAAFAAMLLVLGPFSGAALAAPEITLDKQAPATVLFGEQSEVTLRAANPSDEHGYNLSFRDVLPEGVSYVMSSSSAVEPRVIENAPNEGETTLIFENLVDLSPKSSYDLRYRVSHSTTIFQIGESYENEADAYVSEDPHLEPVFDAKGLPEHNVDGEAGDSAVTEISAIEIEKNGTGPAEKLLRGVHDFQTVYNLVVKNNAVEPTTGVVVEDWLPAGLEFLGCGDEDNTTDAFTNPDGTKEEYPGSGLLNPGHAPPTTKCVAPTAVETVNTDPDGSGGPMPSGVYTRVRWNALGPLAVSGKIELQYVAAIPIRENTTDWTGAEPLTTGEQGSNLDNNSGTETFHDQALTNYALAQGDYEGTLPVQAHDTSTKIAKDVLVEKSVDPTVIDQGEISKWTLHIQASEYRYVKNVRVTDTLPDGLCPLGSVNFEDDSVEPQTAECDPTGDNPTVPYTEATEDENGTYTLKWNETTVPGLALLEPTGTFTIEFPTRTRGDYQEDFKDEKPVLAEDSWENTVAVAGADYRICAPGEAVCAVEGTGEIDGDEANGTDDADTAAASQHANGITIAKQIREREPLSVDCQTGAYVDTPQKYRAGDQVCWKLHIEFPGKLDTGEPTVTDFLPPGSTYVAGSEEKTAANTVEGVAFDESSAALGILTWTFGADVKPGKIFEVRFKTKVGQDVSDVPGLLKGNLMKFSYENSSEVSFPERDEAEFIHSQALLDLEKGVLDVNGGPPVHEPPIDDVQVSAGDVVTYRIDVENKGDVAAENVEVWDNLEDGIACTDVVEGSLSGGICTGTQIVWTGVTVGAEAKAALSYDVKIPTGVEPGRQFHDEAGIVGYTSKTNTGEDFPYVPAENIDPSKTEPNAPAADDSSSVHTRPIGITKTRTTQIGEEGNKLADEATIGERIDYVLKIVIPEGTTIYGSPKLSDPLAPRQIYSASPAAEATLDGAPLEEPPFELKAEGGEVSLQFPPEYENPSGSKDDTFEIKFSATVADIGENKRTGTKLKNTGTFTWHHFDGAKKTQPAHVETTIVEPDVALAKADDDADDTVEPGQTVNYTLTASNPSGTDVSTAHDLVLVDHLPEGLTPTEFGGGTWDEMARTITWEFASLEPGEQIQRSYAVEVDDPAVADEAFPNTAELTATSMPGAVTGERGPTSEFDEGYVATAEAEVRIGDATLTKSVVPGEATIGEQVTYTTEVTFPANVSYFDATVIDTLPDGLLYDETVSVTCDSGGGGECDDTHTELGPESSEGVSRVAWFLGDLTNEPIVRTYQIVYKAHVADKYFDEAPVTGGETLTNTAAAFYNSSDEMGVPSSVPDPGEFTGTSGPDSAEVDVTEPEIAIGKKVSGDGDEDGFRTTEAGEAYTYSLVVENTGTAPAYDIEVTDTFDPSQLVNVSVPMSSEVVDADGSNGEISWLLPGPLLPGQKTTLTYDADLAESALLSQGEDVLNTARVPHFWGAPKAERDANPEVDYRDYKDTPPDTVTLEVLLPSLEVEKTVGDGGPGGDIAEIGEPFAWRVVVKNSSQAIAKSVDVHDTLPANWEYVANSAEFTPGGKVEPTIVTGPAGDTLTWENRGDLAPSGELVLTFEAVPTVAAAGDPGPGANVNEADAAADDTSGAGASAEGPYADEDEAQATLALPQLNVVKTPDGGTIDAGEAGSYTIEVSNTGTVPAREVVVTDVLGADQTYQAGTASAVPPTGFSEQPPSGGPGGSTTIVWDIDEIPAGQSVTITVPFDTDPGLGEGTELDNDVSVLSREITTPDDDEGGYEVHVAADVSVEKQTLTDPVVAGEEVEFKLTVENHGPSNATGVKVEDTLPSYLQLTFAGPPCTQEGNAISCEIGEFEVDETAEIIVKATVDPDQVGQIENTATVTTTSPDPEPENDESTTEPPLVTDANVTVQKRGPNDAVLREEVFEYEIEVTNNGVSTAVDVEMTDELPAGVNFVAEGQEDEACEESGGVVTCTWAKLEPNETKVVTFEVKSTEVGEKVNTAVVSTESTETNPDDNESEFPVTVVEPKITIEKKVSGDADEDGHRTTVPGNSYTYSLVIRNVGTGIAYDVDVKDSPDNAKLQNIKATLEPTDVKIVDGDGDDGTLEWTIEALAPDESVTIEYDADLRPSAALSNEDQIVNTAHVPVYWGVPDHESSVPPATPYEDDPEDSVTLEVILPELALEKKVGPTGAADEAPAEVGVPFTWWVEVRNDSTLADAQAIEISDVLPANWEYVAGSTEVNGAAVPDPGVFVGTPPVGDTLTWSGLPNLPAEASFILTFEAKPTAAAGQVPGHGAGQPNVNEARVSGEDGSGAGASAEGPYADEDEAQATLELPQLNVVKTPDDGDINAGEAGSYTIEVSNTGTVPAREVVVTDVLGAGQTYQAGTASAVPPTGFSEQPPSGGPGGSTTIVWDIDEILGGQSVTITVPFDTDPGLEAGELDNGVSVVSREITTPDEDEGGYEAHVSADVEIEKSTVTNPVVAGQNVEYTLTVRNLGPSDATGVEVEDALPSYLEFVSAENPCTDQGGGLVKCLIGPLAANGEVELTVTAKVDPAQTADAVNTAKVTSTSPDPDDDNNEDTVEDPVTVRANVKVEKTGPAAPVLQGSTFTYDIVVSNTDVSTAVNVEMTDQLPSQVAFLDIVAGPCTESGGTVTCNWATLAPGESDTVTIEVEAVEVAPEPGAMNEAIATTDSPETNTGDNEDEAPAVILPMADLAVVKTAPETVDAGSELKYDIKVTNEGPSKATGVVASDALPFGVHYVSSEPECTHATGTVTCQVGELEPSESRDYTITVAVPYALADKTLANIVTVDGNEGDLVNGNNTDEAETKVGPAADILVTKTAGGATAGGTASWTILVENRGPSAAPVKVSDVLPAGTMLRSATPSQGSCSANGNEAVCDLGILHSGASAQIAVLADVAAGTTGQQLRNHAKANSPHPDPDPTNNESEAINQVKNPPQTGPQLSMVKTASNSQPKLGKPFSYKLLIRNDGGGDAHKVKVTDTMNKSVDVKQAHPSKGKCSMNGSKVTCSLGTIPAHQQAGVTVVVVPVSPGGLRNTASVSSADGGEADATDNIDVAGVRVEAPPASVRISKRALRRSVRGGQNVPFRIVVKVGPRAVAEATVCDRLPAGLVFVKAPGARLQGGSSCWEFPYLAANARKTMKVVTRADRGFSVKRVRNVAVVKGANASRARATAPLRIAPAYAGAPGGVTG